MSPLVHIEQRRLFGEATYRWLPTKSYLSIRFIILLFNVPKDFRGVTSTSEANGTASSLDLSGGRELTAYVGNFLPGL